MELAGSEHVALDRLDQHHAEFNDLADPAAHAGAIKCHAVAGRDLRLAIQGLVIRELRYRDIGQQAWMRDAALDRQARHRQLFDMATAGAKQFAPDRADHLECGGYARELFGDVLAQRLHGRRALGAERIRLEYRLLARQVRRERLQTSAIAKPDGNFV